MYKLVIAKLENTPVDLRKLNDVVKNQVVENTLNNELVKKAMLFRLLILVIQLKKADYNRKIAKIEKKILDHNHGKYVTTQEFNNLTVDIFVARLAQTKLTTKAGIADFVKETDFGKKLKKYFK